MKATRKAYFELYFNDKPVVAGGRKSHRHTSLVEAIEHAEQYAAETGDVGIYEVRVGKEVYYTLEISDPSTPPTSRLRGTALIEIYAMALVLGSPWYGGFFGSATVGVVANAAYNDEVTIDTIPNISLTQGQTHNMGQYINDPLQRITASQILNLDTNVATYSHATKLLTSVGPGSMNNLQLEVTFT